MAKGFTILELVVTLGILSALLLLGLPLYRKNLRRRGVESAAGFFETQYRERKERAVALGEPAGLCVEPDGALHPYEGNPFSPGAFSVLQAPDPGKTFGVPIEVNVISSGSAASAPCSPAEWNVQLSPLPDTSADWEGEVDFLSDAAEWRVRVQGGALTDGP